MKFFLPIFFLLAMLPSFHCFSQTKSQHKDSIELSTKATDFFNWYILSAKAPNGSKCTEYNPIEIQDLNGMTTLDFSRYFQNLIRLSFSDSLISKEKSSYNICLNKLSKITYTDYKKLTDLSDFEALEDNFTNYYRWTGGQEMYDGYCVTSLKYENNNAVVVGYLYFKDTQNIEIKNSIRVISMTFIKQNNDWKIAAIRY